MDDHLFGAGAASRIRPRFIVLALRILLLLRQSFDQDLELAVIFLVLLEQATKADRFGSLLAKLQDSASEDWNDLPGSNAKSISDSTSIPRETVRRKLRLLEQKGWIARRSDGVEHVTRAAMIENLAIGEEIIRLALAAAGEIASTQPERGD